MMRILRDRPAIVLTCEQLVWKTRVVESLGIFGAERGEGHGWCLPRSPEQKGWLGIIYELSFAYRLALIRRCERGRESLPLTRSDMGGKRMLDAKACCALSTAILTRSNLE